MSNILDFKKILAEQREKARESKISHQNTLNAAPVRNKENIIDIESSEGCNLPDSSKDNQTDHEPFESFSSSFHINTHQPKVDSDNVLSIETLSHHKVGSIPSMYYISDIFDTNTESLMLDCIYRRQDAWIQLKTRKLQCFGPGFDGHDSSPLPNWLDFLIDKLVESNIFELKDRPNHVLINQYEADQGIIHHTDGPAYVNRVVIISLESPCIMTFRRKLKSEEIGEIYDGDLLSIVLQPRSALIFSDSIYSEYMHGIDADPATHIVGYNDVECLNTEKALVYQGQKVNSTNLSSNLYLLLLRLFL